MRLGTSFVHIGILCTVENSICHVCLYRKGFLFIYMKERKSNIMTDNYFERSRKFGEEVENLKSAIREAEEATRAYAENAIAGNGEGLFREYRSKRSSLGDAIIRFLDLGYELHTHNPFTSTNILSTEKSDDVQRGFVRWNYGLDEEDCPHCGNCIGEFGDA